MPKGWKHGHHNDGLDEGPNSTNKRYNQHVGGKNLHVDTTQNRILPKILSLSPTSLGHKPWGHAGRIQRSVAKSEATQTGSTIVPNLYSRK